MAWTPHLGPSSYKSLEEWGAVVNQQLSQMSETLLGIKKVVETYSHAIDVKLATIETRLNHVEKELNELQQGDKPDKDPKPWPQQITQAGLQGGPWVVMILLILERVFNSGGLP